MKEAINEIREIAPAAAVFELHYFLHYMYFYTTSMQSLTVPPYNNYEHKNKTKC